MNSLALANKSIQSLSRFTLGVAVALLVTVFVIALPATALLFDAFQETFGADGPGIADWLVATSPWLPLVVGIGGAAALICKERRCQASLAAMLNVAAILVTLIASGLVLFTVWFAMVQVLWDLNN